MPEYYYEDQVKVFGPPSHSGHETYNAFYRHDNTLDERIIFKKNKFGFANFSRMEVAFSQLAKLFLMPGLTTSQRLVVDKNNQWVKGIGVQHLMYVIQNKEGLKHSFYSFENPAYCLPVDKGTVSKPEDIPFYFLDKLPQGLYLQLVKAEKEGKLKINYESIASVLATSYTLEEDDLHKGNFGFYIVEKEGKPQVVFFKIDHDLMFVDSIMGFCTKRPFHLFHGPSAFDIFEDDLTTFPNLKHSANSYWPTKFSWICDPFNKKEYRHFGENSAFAALEKEEEFKKAKWRIFYKHILIPRKLIKTTLENVSDSSNPSDRAFIALMTHTMVARLASLRAVLFSVKSFREFVAGLTDADHASLLKEINPEGNEEVNRVIINMIKKYNTLLAPDSPNKFEEGDTPLHTAIKLGEYRYAETTRMFGHFMDTKNSAGKTPLDVALELKDKCNKHICQDMPLIMKHLLDKGARKTQAYEDAKIDSEIQSYKYINPYCSKITNTTSYTEMKEILRDIGEAHEYCLKYKKNLAVECINKWIVERKSNPGFMKELDQLRKDVNGSSPEAEHSGLKYIRQLRSSLWIVRQLRGLYGWSSTLMEINAIIDKTVKPRAASYSSFFYDVNKYMNTLAPHHPTPSTM